MNDKFIKVILSGILLCLLVITFKINNKNEVPYQTPNVDIDNRGRVVQIAPNRIGVIDTGNESGWEQLVIFEYNPDTKSFNVVSSLPYEDIFNHPKEHGIPVRSDKYGN